MASLYARRLHALVGSGVCEVGPSSTCLLGDAAAPLLSAFVLSLAFLSSSALSLMRSFS